ncbi:MAG: di-heme oxidoredictase family protein [Isosphaeraceae bacterium]|nr:di-heme oxidoredictase family protein [Isosphaeraceae bacterium]
MSNTPLRRHRGYVAVLGLSALLTAPAMAEDAAGNDKAIALGRGLFAREWVVGDARSHGGDGLGPVYNERSCAGCHHLGGPGGAATADKNIDILSPAGDASSNGGFFYAFSMNFGGEGFDYRISNNAPNTRPKPVDVAALVRLHPGFREASSVVLHRYGPDADYRSWREQVPGPHGTVALRVTQRNPTPLFGIGLIDGIPDEAIEAAARRRLPAASAVKGRVSRLADGRVGRFGWKAQTATLREFVLSAAAGELGLEVPGRRQAADPRVPPIAAPGLDLNEDECTALTAYVASLPPPRVLPPGDMKQERTLKAGATTFRAIGCAHCHVPKLGKVDGLYSDLLLHDMSPLLADTGFYGVFTASDPAPAPKRGPNGKPAGANVQEWRTPPLWGLRDSYPYMHDGRAETIEQAIAFHGGEGAGAAQRYAQLSARERQQVEEFLLSLAAPKQP